MPTKVMLSLGLEALNHDHHTVYACATNHDTHRTKHPYAREQSSIEQLMEHQYTMKILFNHFLLDRAVQRLSPNREKTEFKLRSFAGGELGQKYRATFTQSDHSVLQVSIFWVKMVS